MNKERDLLGWRLTAILQKLNEGKRLKVNQLAEEFNVHRRTILRDLNERFCNLPLIEDPKGEYTLERGYLGCLSFKDIEWFAKLSGIQGLFPGLESEFFKELFDSRLQKTLEIHAPSYEDLNLRLDDFRKLQDAISENRKIAFTYKKDEGEKQVEVSPYRLINNNDVWYLAATDQGRAKSYSFSKISTINLLDEKFAPDTAIEQMLNSEDSIWLNEKKIEVVLTISPPAATYFKRRKLISQQIIEKELEDGGLIVSGKFAHQNQILPIVRYWIPHIRIVSPKNWQEELEKCMNNYLSK